MMRLELIYPSNWAYEGSVDVCYVEPNGAEKSYGTLQQGSTMVRETYEGHRWHVREVTSRELLMSVVARDPANGLPQIVTIGSDGGLDPLKAALWRMGRHPREPLLKAVLLLLKVVGNILKSPAEAKFRSLKASNERVREALDVPGVLALLGCAAFEQQLVDGEPKLLLPADKPTA